MSAIGDVEQRRPFLLLSQPRSGSNYLSVLLKAQRLIQLQVEPFSMHTSDFLSQDLRECGSAASALQCRCAECFSCDLRTWLEGGVHRGFKETILFEKLPLVAAWMPQLRVVYLVRDHDGIVQSHLANDLVERWRLPHRYVDHECADISAAAQSAIRDKTKHADLVRTLCEYREQLWRAHATRFEHIVVSYRALSAEPAAVLDVVMHFLGLERDWLQDLCIAEHQFGDRVGPYGTFGRSQQVPMKAVGPETLTMTGAAP